MKDYEDRMSGVYACGGRVDSNNNMVRKNSSRTSSVSNTRLFLDISKKNSRPKKLTQIFKKL